MEKIFSKKGGRKKNGLGKVVLGTQLLYYHFHQLCPPESSYCSLDGFNGSMSTGPPSIRQLYKSYLFQT